MKKIIFICVIICIINNPLFSQINSFFFDILITKCNDIDSTNIDFYCCIPNKTLKFNKQGTKYIANFSLIVSFVNIENNKTTSFDIKQNTFASNYEEVQGINGNFSLFTKSIKLSPGSYKIRTLLTDNISGKEYSNSRSFSVINYYAFDFSISSILLLSSIEEIKNEYIITPYLNDNVNSLSDGYFAFFEIYNDTEERTINLYTEIKNNDNENVIYSSSISKKIDIGVTQCYVNIPTNIKYGLGSNTLRIFAFDEVEGTISTDSAEKILAVASRSIRSISTISDYIIKDIDKSIRQLRYVATSKQIDSIIKAESDADKLRLFEIFWKRLDPTPHTEKNEALEEYYKRIEYANENFKAYQEGWLTDKGQVYIIYGPPMNIDRTNNSFADNRTFERWIYGNQREIVFLDVSGFGDFRLYSPSIITDKFSFDF